MAGIRVSKLVGLAAVVMMAGCAHRSVEIDASTPQIGAAGSAPVIDPNNPADISSLGARLTHNRLTLFSVKQDKYTFYVGGVLNATYEMDTKILRISALTAEDNTARTCEYTPQGTLFVDTKTQANKEGFVSDCNRLVERLNDYLSR